MTGKITARQLDYIKDLHKLVIHQKSGTNRQYFLESRKIALLNDDQVRLVCQKCFGKIKMPDNQLLAKSGRKQALG